MIIKEISSRQSVPVADKRVLTDDRIEEVAEAVMKAASKISHRMGYVE